MGIPKLKKKLQAFLLNEDGNISRESLLKAGAIISTAALSSALVSAAIDHTNSQSISAQGDAAVGQHSHHAQHASGTATATGTGTGTGTYY